MDFEIPREIGDKLRELDAFIAKEIRPLEEQDVRVAQILFGVSRRPKGAPPELTRAAD